MRLLELLALTVGRPPMTSAHIIGFATAVLLACAAPGAATESAAPEPSTSVSDTVPLSQPGRPSQNASPRESRPP